MFREQSANYKLRIIKMRDGKRRIFLEFVGDVRHQYTPAGLAAAVKDKETPAK